MTNEEKLRILLQIAIENGWKDNLYQIHIMKHNFEILPDILQLRHSEKDLEFLTSLNDLITNFEKGQVSFIQALCDAYNDSFEYSHTAYNWQKIRKQWDTYDDEYYTPRLTSERLYWLFDTFKRLLTKTK